jgi:D-glycero-alpha-D-manno-heptose-7-phosphate kinase
MPDRVLTARAPTRIDFGGGWTDVPPYPVTDGGFVCNIAITRYATVRIRTRRAGDPTGAVEGRDATADSALAAAALRRARLSDAALRLASDFPVGAGLGGSSAAGVAAVGALAAWRMGDASTAAFDADRRAALAEESRAIEIEDLGVAGGRQDHYAAAFGGALALRFGTGVEVERIDLSPALVEAIERRCIVAYTGQSRISGTTITGVIDAYTAREPRVTAALARMKALAELMADALRRSSLDDLGRLVEEHWVHQRALHPGIATPRIDAIVERARAAGALGTKALGASGGGCVLVVAPEGGTVRVREAIGDLVDPLSYAVDHAGVRVDEGGHGFPGEG